MPKPRRGKDFIEETKLVILASPKRKAAYQRSSSQAEEHACLDDYNRVFCSLGIGKKILYIPDVCKHHLLQLLTSTT
jgi:hypothetical protein